MKSLNKKVLIWSFVFLLIFIILIVFPLLDLKLTLFINSFKSDSLDFFMLWITNIGSGIVVFFIVTALFLYEERKRKWIPPLWLGFFVSTLLVLLLKITVLRERPFEILNVPIGKEFAFWNSSFPSWHAAMVFSALPVLGKEFSKIKLFWIIFAVLVAISRVYLLYHFVSDVIMGSLIGYFSGLFFLGLWSRKKVKSKIK